MEEDTQKTNPGSKTDLSRKRQKGLRKWLFVPAAILGLLILGALIIFPRLNFNPAQAPGNIQTATATGPAPMDAAPTLGPQNAPVTIIEYADFGCPACWYWYKLGVLDQLRDRYGDQLRFVWRDYPVITLLSPKAAEAGQCANEQGKFWEFHDTIYEHERAIRASDLEAYANAIGLNMGLFNECVSSRRYQDRVNAEQHEAFSHGFNGAPFFLVNDQVLIGPQSLPVFEGLIDPLMAARK
jgi:protein-disulfide isomerase